jgi:hypothetical protein
MTNCVHPIQLNGMMPLAASEKKTARGWWDRVVSYIDTAPGVKNLNRVLKTGLEWWKGCSRAPLPKSAVQLHSASADADRLLTCMEAPKKLAEWGNSVKQLARGEGGKARALADVALKTNSLVSPVWSGTTFLQGKGVIHLSAEALKRVNTVGAGAMVIGSLDSTRKTLTHIAASRLTDPKLSGAERAQESRRMTWNMMELAKNVSYLALGVLLAGIFALGWVISPLVTLALTTTGLFLTFAHHFYGEAHALKPPAVGKG